MLLCLKRNNKGTQLPNKYFHLFSGLRKILKYSRFSKIFPPKIFIIQKVSRVYLRNCVLVMKIHRLEVLRTITKNTLLIDRRMPTKVKCSYGPTNSYVVTSPIGDIEVVSCPKGLHSLSQIGDTDEYFSPDKSVKVDVKSQLYQDNGYTYKPILQCVEWLQNYFRPSADQLKLPPLCSSIFKEGSFCSTAQKVLADEVRFGQTISYKRLAILCGNERACQAVGTAMKNNPISIIVPCHRVIKHSGNLGNYHGGQKNSVKQWLLKHEHAIP